MPAADRLVRLPASLRPAGLGLLLLGLSVAADAPPAAPVPIAPEEAAEEAAEAAEEAGVPPAVQIPGVRIQITPAEPAEAADEPAVGSMGPNLFATDRVAARRLRLAEDRIADGVYDEAADLLQAVLDAEEDAAVPTDESDGTFRSLKGRALDLIAGLPPDGKRIYELKYGVAARKRLEEALAAGDWESVEAVSRQFFHTTAGREATYRLAVQSQDRGEPLHAAILFERLVDSEAKTFEPQLSLRAAAAWAQAGFPESAREAAERVSRQAAGGLELGGTPVPEAAAPDELLALLERDRGGAMPETDRRWPALGREPDRTADVDAVTVAGGAEWSRRFDARTEWDGRRDLEDAAKLSATLELVTAVAAETGELTQPAFHPIVAGDAVVVRTLRGIEAVDLATGRFLWRTERPHDVLYDRALDGISLFMRTGSRFGGVGRASLLEEYVAQYAWRNLTSGTLSADGKYVYGIEGVGLVGGMAHSPQGGSRDEPIGNDSFNTLFAYELAAEGRIAWTAGGPPTQAGASGTFFLGPPLPLGGRLYALAEEDGEIRLVVLDPAAERDEERTLWLQSLVAADTPIASKPAFSADPLRKISGLSPAFSDGVLVCPTGTGAVVAIDLGRRLLLWGYQYPRNIMTRSGPGRGVPMIAHPAIAPDDEADRWLDAVPRIAGGAVYLTPRDSDELHCIDLADGRLRWKRPRGADLFLATVHDGKAVVVGRRHVTALDAETGKPVWRLSLGSLGGVAPAGRGVRSGDLYHLPLSAGEIVTLRLSTGEELGRSPVGEGAEAGNLIAADGRLLMQSTAAISGFRRFEDLHAELRERLTASADPAAIALRGEDRLHRGETEAGLADLRAAVAAAELPRAKRLLVEALLEGLRTDFAAFRKYEKDLLELADTPGQRWQVLRLLADGLKETGEHQAAFETFLRLADGGPAALPLEPAGDGLTVRADRSLRLRIAELYADAAPDVRAAMDARLADRLGQLAAERDTAALERFIGFFYGTPAAEDGLRLLAEAYAAAGDRLRHEQTLLRLDALRPGDGAPEADPTTNPSHQAFDVTYKAEYLPDEVNTPRRPSSVQTRFAVQVVGPRPADLSDWRFDLDAARRSLCAFDRFNRLLWKVDVRPEDERDVPIRYRQPPHVRFCGHLMAFVVGTQLVVFDLTTPGEPRELWSRDLFRDSVDRRLAPVDPRMFMGEGWRVLHGPIGFAGAELLLYQTGTTVTAADPVTGETLWQRGNVRHVCEMSGDGEFVVLQPFTADEVSVLRTADGTEVASRTTIGRGTADWFGTRMVAWQRTEDGFRLDCRDVARDQSLWSYDFPVRALYAPIGSDEAAVLDPTTGALRVIRLADGATVFTAAIDADPTVVQFHPVRTFGRYLFFTRRANRAGQVRVERNGGMFPLDGLAYAFDAAGRRLWSAAIDGKSLPLEQPTGLPVLFLAATLLSTDRPPSPSHHATVLDVRTGRFLIEQKRQRSFFPFEVVADAATGSITIAVEEARFVLSPTDEPLPPARTDDPDDLPQAQEPAAEVIPVRAP